MMIVAVAVLFFKNRENIIIIPGWSNDEKQRRKEEREMMSVSSFFDVKKEFCPTLGRGLSGAGAEGSFLGPNPFEFLLPDLPPHGRGELRVLQGFVGVFLGFQLATKEEK